MACPTAHKCVAFGGHNGKGAIAVSSNPGAGRWKAVTLKKDNFGFNVGICHGTGFCFALSDYWSANPKASRSVWHSTNVRHRLQPGRDRLPDQQDVPHR